MCIDYNHTQLMLYKQQKLVNVHNLLITTSTDVDGKEPSANWSEALITGA